MKKLTFLFNLIILFSVFASFLHGSSDIQNTQKNISKKVKKLINKSPCGASIPTNLAYIELEIDKKIQTYLGAQIEYDCEKENLTFLFTNNNVLLTTKSGEKINASSVILVSGRALFEPKGQKTGSARQVKFKKEGKEFGPYFYFDLGELKMTETKPGKLNFIFLFRKVELKNIKELQIDKVKIQW